MGLRDAAYRAFTHQLVAREIRPGALVSQRELSERTGFPLGAIREMIPRLEAEGLIRAIPQRGLQVLAPDARLVREAFALRALIEHEALAFFVATAPEAAIEAERAALAGVIAEAEAGITPELLVRAQAVDWGFHDRLVESLDNRLIAEAYRVNAIRIRMMTPERVTLSAAYFTTAMREHMAIVAALARRASAAARAALDTHLESARRRALALGPTLPEGDEAALTPR
ncbi:MAG: GntR family transcriptional regulator [Rhodospirillales bacterium]|nr:GntR family transcriptional regulator [Rhodospirillales bacterium]